MKQQKRNEKTVIFNTGLDLLYMGIGGWMMHKRPLQIELNQGIGASILTQGGFLFAFDALMYARHRKNRLKITKSTL